MSAAGNSVSTVTETPLPCPLCHSTDVQSGICYPFSGSADKEDAVRCAACGCRATLASWQARHVSLSIAQAAPQPECKADFYALWCDECNTHPMHCKRAQPLPAGDKGEAVAWPAPRVTNPDIANPTGVPYLDCLIHRVLDAQQDINLAANEGMSQSLCDAAALMDEVETALRLAAPRPAGIAYAAIEPEVFTRRLELARKFIAGEYNDPAQELRGDWIDPRAKPAHDALCLCLQDLSALSSTDRGAEA